VNLDVVMSLWADHMNQPFPDELRWIDAPSGESVPALDAYLAGCVTAYIAGQGTLDPQRRQILTDCAGDLAAVLPSLERQPAAYVARLIEIVNLIIGKH